MGGPLTKTAADGRGWLARRLRVKEPRLALFIDGFCPHCRAIGLTLSKLDVRGVLHISSFRHSTEYRLYGISAQELERRMYAVELAEGTPYSGFSAVRRLTRQVLVLWPLRPVLAVIGAVGLGDRCYDWMASRRRIVPDPTVCTDACRLPGATTDDFAEAG